MINYLEWLAQYVIEWPEHYTHGFVITENGIPQYVRFNYGQGFSKAEWRAERDEMESPYSGNPERFKANGRLQIKKWGVAEDDFLAPEVGIVESFLGHSFSTPEEDEAFDAIAKKQGCSVCGCKNEQIENERLRAQIQSLRDYCDKLLAGRKG